MNINELKKLYIENGLEDFILKDTDDLLKAHKVDYTKIKGYDKLDDVNRRIFKKFIVKFYNARGLESRINTNPLSIYYVENIDYTILHPDNERMKDHEDKEDIYLSIGTVINAIYRNGEKELIKEHKDNGYDYKEYYKEIKISNYLRFELEYYGSNEWLHIIKKGQEWY